MTAAKDDSGKGIDYLWSCMLGSGLAMLLAVALVYIHPNTRGHCYDGAAHTCMWFIAILYTAPIVTGVLSIILYWGHRYQRRSLDQLLLIIGVAAAFAQALFSGFGIWFSRDSMHYLSYSDVIFVPHGFVAGSVTGVIYWAVLWLLRHRYQ
ncbi:MAG: hypothetical protein AAGA19_13945 [Pseudomonadota bacterium]